MNPLTVTWAPHLYTDWGWKNFQSWLGAGFYNYLMTPNQGSPLVNAIISGKLIPSISTFMIGQKGFAPKIAEKLGISLIFYGENEAEYGNPLKDTKTAKRDWDYFSGDDTSKIHLGGSSIKDLTQNYGLKMADLEPYMPANPLGLEKNKTEVHYLGYYIPWHPQGAYYYAVELGDFQASPERTTGTYSKYNSIDDKIDDFHYFTTFIKFGIGRATYDAAQEIRNNEITREEGVALVKKYDGEFPERFADEIFSYLSLQPFDFPEASKMFQEPVVTREYFDQLTDRFRSPHLWEKRSQSWELRHTVWK